MRKPKLAKGWIVQRIDAKGNYPHDYHTDEELGDKTVYRLERPSTGDAIWMAVRTTDKKDLTKHYFNIYRSKPQQLGLDPNIKTLKEGIDLCNKLTEYFDLPTEKIELPGIRPGYYAKNPLFKKKGLQNILDK